VRTE
jgi:hypothetical protein